MNCQICKEPIDGDQRFHESCLQCEYCKNHVGVDQIHYCLKQEIPVSHQNCREKYVREISENRQVSINLKELNLLNDIAYMIRSNRNLNLESNKVVATNYASKYFHDKTLDEQLYSLRMIEAVAAHLHHLITKNPQRLQIMLDERDLERVQSAETYRKQSVEKKQRKQVEARKKLDPQAARDEKAISYLMQIGMSREAAMEQIEKNRKKI